MAAKGCLAGHGQPHADVSEIQRTRLFDAAVAAIDRLGYPRATVAHITRAARISRRTFYEQFANREELLLAVLDETVATIERQLQLAAIDALPWLERIRSGVAAILDFFDREPTLARVCVVHTLQCGPAVLERRERIAARLVAALEAGGGPPSGRPRCSSLTAEGLVGATLAILQARLMRAEPGSLSELRGELMAMIVLPYLGPAAARREQAAPAVELPPQSHETGGARRARGARHPLQDLPMRVTYRTARVLAVIAEHPGASNRSIAQHAGIHDQGQVSKLLGRLQGLGLAARKHDGHAKGLPNAWHLTAAGEAVAQTILRRSDGPCADEPRLGCSVRGAAPAADRGISPQARRMRRARQASDGALAAPSQAQAARTPEARIATSIEGRDPLRSHSRRENHV